MTRFPFILDNCEQLDVTPAQAAHLSTLDLIYRPEGDENPDYYSLPWNVTFDQVELALREAQDDARNEETQP